MESVPTKNMGFRKDSSRGKTHHDDGSKSGGSMGEVERPISDDDLLRIMECPVCNEFPAPPIYCCEKGHFTCNSCMELLESCSLCEAPYTNVRNFALESIIESSKFKCRNAHLGCPEIVTGAVLNRHVSDCLYRPLGCKEPGCLCRNLAPNEYWQHIVERHEYPGCDKEIIGGTVLVVVNQKEGLGGYHPYYVKTFAPGISQSPTFMIMTMRHRTFMCWWVVCLEPEYIDDYKVRISLQAKDLEDLSVHWTLPMQPIWKDFDEVRDTGRCAVLPDTNLLAFYSDEKSWDLKVEFLKKINLCPSNNPINEYYLLLLLVLIGVIAVLVTIFAEGDAGLSNSPNSHGLNQSIPKNDNEDLDEYIGYRGFYYKA